MLYIHCLWLLAVSQTLDLPSPWDDPLPGNLTPNIPSVNACVRHSKHLVCAPLFQPVITFR